MSLLYFLCRYDLYSFRLSFLISQVHNIEFEDLRRHYSSPETWNEFDINMLHR